MREVTVNKTNLVNVIKANREQHRGRFEQAIDGWRRKVIEDLEAAVEAAKAGREYKTNFYLPCPEDHTPDYDDVLGMLDMHVDDTVELSIGEYQQYVNDDWRWKRDFMATSETYLVS